MYQRIVLKEHAILNQEITIYPDGQRVVAIDFDNKVPVIIDASIKTFSDLELLISMVGAIRKQDGIINKLNFFYLHGQRGDRAFSNNSSAYFTTVIAPIINSLGIDNIIIYFPHSKAINYAIKNSFAAFQIDENVKINSYWRDKIIIGADKPMLNSSESFIKNRLDNGSIQVILPEESRRRIAASLLDILIVDDLLDAGGTFIEIAKYLDKFFPNRKKLLFVAHALFTKGVERIAEHYDHIYCTNSYQKISHPKVTCMEVI